MTWASIFSFIVKHDVATLLGLLYVSSAMVNALPPPGSTLPFGQLFYQWFFNVIHTMLNQAEKVAASRYPQAAAIVTHPTPLQEAAVLQSSSNLNLNQVKENL